MSDELIRITVGKDGLALGATVSIEDYNQGDDIQVVVCMRCVAGRPLLPSLRRHCDECREPIWMLPDTQRLVRKMRKPMILCLECAMPRMAQDKNPLKRGA